MSPGYLHGIHILLVEDDPDTLDLLATAMQRSGAATVVAVSTFEAACHAIDCERFDVLVSDIVLDEGRTGLELARKIIEAGGHRPALVGVSGRGNDADVTAGLDAGFDAYLVKPVVFSSLLDAIVRAVTARSRR
ncbi:MAG TPA: response regulator [Polyangiaceae bacterium]